MAARAAPASKKGDRCQNFLHAKLQRYGEIRRALDASALSGFGFLIDRGLGGGVVHKLEAIKILEAKLAAIEREHHAELAGDEDMRDHADAKAEAKTPAAVFDFLKVCKISHRGSLLRVLERYLRRKSTAGRGRDAPATQGAKGILAGLIRAQPGAGAVERLPVGAVGRAAIEVVEPRAHEVLSRRRD